MSTVSLTRLDSQPLSSVPVDEAALEEMLSRPTPGVLETLDRLDGDIAVLGVGGKMGPTLARMARRGLDALGKKNRVLGVARFSDPATEAQLNAVGVETIRCNLLDRESVQRLPDVPNVIFMAGQKFGTVDAPELTWVMNALVPSLVAEKYTKARTVVFSTGCVYAYVPVTSGGSLETDFLDPVGEYAHSCIARERIFSHYAKQNGTPLAIYRLYYAIDMRYGVLPDVAWKVLTNTPIDVTMGHANVIWQGDANAQAIQCLEQASNPPCILNVTGPETISLRALAKRFGELLDREPNIIGQEDNTALLGNAGQAHRLFGYPTVTLEQMILWVAEWVKQGGRSLNKPTHFETRDGKY